VARSAPRCRGRRDRDRDRDRGRGRGRGRDRLAGGDSRFDGRTLGGLGPAGQDGDRGEIERRIGEEDALLQLPEAEAGFDSALLGQHGAGPRVGVQGLGLPSGPVEAEHELLPPAFPQRFRGGAGDQGRQQVAVPAEGQLRIGQEILRRPPVLEQLEHVRLHHRRRREVGQGRIAPGGEGPLQQARRSGDVPDPLCLPAPLHQVVELLEIELVARPEPEGVAVRLGLEAVIEVEPLAEAVDVAAQGAVRIAQGMLAPQRLGQVGTGHRSTGVNQKNGENRPLPRSC
jgi:hypothetical protein